MIAILNINLITVFITIAVLAGAIGVTISIRERRRIEKYLEKHSEGGRGPHIGSKYIPLGPKFPMPRYILPVCLSISLAAICYLLIRVQVTELGDGSIVYKSQLYTPENLSHKTNAVAFADKEVAALKEQYQTEMRLRYQQANQLASLSAQYMTAQNMLANKAHTTPRARLVTAQPGASQQPAAKIRTASPPPAAAITGRQHAAAAEAYALDYFRFKSDLANNSISITASINIKETKEVPNWNRYGSKGEANITYATSQGGLRTVTRTFEVYTEEKDGRAQGIDITVGF